MLKNLWLRQNYITIIPDKICELFELETLSLSSNKLSTLPNLHQNYMD